MPGRRWLALVVVFCSGVSRTSVAARVAEIERQDTQRGGTNVHRNGTVYIERERERISNGKYCRISRFPSTQIRVVYMHGVHIPDMAQDLVPS